MMLRPTVQRLYTSPPLQAAWSRIHRCGPRASASCIAEMLDFIHAPPCEIDFVLSWCPLDPDLVRAIAGDDFLTPFDVVRTA